MNRQRSYYGTGKDKVEPSDCHAKLPVHSPVISFSLHAYRLNQIRDTAKNITLVVSYPDNLAVAARLYHALY